MQRTSFAIPIESVTGLPDSGHPILLGSGNALQMPSRVGSEGPQSSAAISDANPHSILKSAKTIYLHSKTAFLTVDTLIRALTQTEKWLPLGLTVVQDPRVADVLVEIDRPLFTYVHTFVIIDKRTTIVLGSGKVTAIDGVVASDGLAKKVIEIFAAERPASVKK